MSIDRQFGVHEIPGTEEPAPTPKREAVSAGFESQMREYVNQIWSKLAELEGRIDDFEGWRSRIAESLREATGFDPRDMTSQGRPLLVADVAGEARGERYGDEPGSTMVGVRAVPPKPRSDKPWEAEGVSKATWYRRHKGATP